MADHCPPSRNVLCSEPKSNPEDDDPPPDLLVEVDPNAPVISANPPPPPHHDAQHRRLKHRSVPPTPISAQESVLISTANNSAPSQYSVVALIEPEAASPASSPKRTHQPLNSQILTADCLEACHSPTPSPTFDHSNLPSPLSPRKAEAVLPRRNSIPQPFTQLAPETKRLLDYQRATHSNPSRASSPITNSFPSDAVVNTLLNMQSPTTSLSSSPSDPSPSSHFIHQLHPSALTSLLDENTSFATSSPSDPDSADSNEPINKNNPQHYLLFTPHGTTLSFSSHLPTKPARAIAALIGLTWRSIAAHAAAITHPSSSSSSSSSFSSDTNTPPPPPPPPPPSSAAMKVAKGHIKSTKNVIFSPSGSELQAAIFELCGFYVAVCKVPGVEGLLVGALCEVVAVREEETQRRKYAEEVLRKDFQDEIRKVEESDFLHHQHQKQLHPSSSSSSSSSSSQTPLLDRIEAIPGFAPQDVRELAQTVLDQAERKAHKKMGGVGKLRVLELKAEAMAEGIGEEVAGLRIPEGS